MFIKIAALTVGVVQIYLNLIPLSLLQWKMFGFPSYERAWFYNLEIS